MEQSFFETEELFNFYTYFYELLDVLNINGYDTSSIKQQINIYVILKGSFIQKQIIYEIADQIKPYHKIIKNKSYDTLNIDKIYIYDDGLTSFLRSNWASFDSSTRSKIFRRLGRMLNISIMLKK